MADVLKLQSTSGMFDYPDPANPSKGTTEQQYIEFEKNKHSVLSSLVADELWQPSTAYTVGQVVKSPNMPANVVARVVTAGISASAEPVWSNAGHTMADGTVKWTMLHRTMDAATQEESGYMSARDKAKLDGIAEGATNVPDYVQSVTESNGKVIVTKGGGDSTIINLIDTFYPIGTVYVSADKSKTKADFPFMKHGMWEEVPANLCLQTGNASEAGTQRNAGLPNITGRRVAMWGGGDYSQRGSYTTGCFKFDADPNVSPTVNSENWNNDGKGTGFAFDASLSNPIYGSSNTVQPPAYMVRAWVRMA